MPQIHDTDNYTVPGGIKLFFNDGSGERDLGNMVDVSLGRNSTELEHFTNRPGLRRKDKVIALSESIDIDFALDEPVIENFILFFKGDASATQGAGTTAVVDQTIALIADYLFTSVGKPALTSVTARQFLDYVYLFDGVSTYTDNSVEADSAAGSAFTINADAGDFLYIGKATQFQSFRIDVSTGMVGYTGTLWEYWNGSAWATLSTTGTATFASDATVTFTIPGSWTENTVNGQNAFWLRFSQTAAAPATPATVLSIGRLALVENTDYTLDPGTVTADGRIRALAAGKVADGEEIKVSYSYGTVTALISNLANAATAEGSARLEVHPQSGRGLSFDIEIPKCQIKNNGNLALSDEQFMKIPLQLVVLDDTDNSPDSPYGRIIVYDA